MKKRLSKRNTNGKEIWIMDNSGLFRYKSRVIIPEDPVLYREVIKLYYNNPLVGYYGIEKILEFLRRS